MVSVLLWGIGTVYSQYVNLVSYYELTEQMKVVGVTDRSIFSSGGTIDGYKLFSPYDAREISTDMIFVMSDIYYGEILAGLESFGIDLKLVAPCRVLTLPGLNLNEYFRLKTSGVSIISNNCWGGIVYRTLGMECISPFKNLFVEDEDYLKLLHNLKEYLSYPPEKDHMAKEIHSGEWYPVIRLKDVFIHCNHCRTYDEAIEKWKRRCKKINWDNLFFEMYSDNVDSLMEFSLLCEDSFYIGFTDKSVLGKNRIETLSVSKGKKLYESVLETAQSKGSYDLVKLLYKGEIRKRSQ